MAMKRTLTRPMPRLAVLALCAAGLRPEAAAADWVDFSGDISVGANSIQDNAFMSRVDAMLTFTLFDIADRPFAFEFGTFGYYYKGDRLIITRFGPKTQAKAYKAYRDACGRDARIRQLWGDDAPFVGS